MKIKFTFLLTIICFGAFAARMSAQQTTTTTETVNKQSLEEVEDADLSITASVTAKELKFEIVPNPTVEFTGKPERKTVWEADRQNLPRPVEPGVTYRNIGVRLRIASRFDDIERIVAEALGEIPVSDAAPQNQTPNATVQPKKSTAESQNKKP
ncbi:MAG TPA: hypothetical protein VNI84_08820 [Pyrinomonadaceae bacterium]|nr:hypothetical protein [Pyrinomonadaceae bacterium]